MRLDLAAIAVYAAEVAQPSAQGASGHRTTVRAPLFVDLSQLRAREMDATSADIVRSLSSCEVLVNSLSIKLHHLPAGLAQSVASALRTNEKLSSFVLQFICEQLATHHAIVLDARSLRVLASEVADSDDVLALPAEVPVPDLDARVYVTVFEAVDALSHQICFQLTNRYESVVLKSLDFMRAQLVPHPSRYMFMYLAAQANPLYLPQIPKGSGRRSPGAGFRNDPDEAAYNWAVRFIQTHGAKLEELGIKSREDTTLFVDSTSNKRYFLLFNWDRRQHRLLTTMLQRLFANAFRWHMRLENV